MEELLLSKGEKHGVSIDSLEFALIMDEEDPVKNLREKFYYPKMKDLPHVDLNLVDPDEDCLYFCGNSLGLCPKRAKDLVNTQLEKWANWGVYGHTAGEIPWAEADLCVDQQMADIAGAKRNEIAVMNGLTVNLHLFMLTFYEPTNTRYKILLESKAFPSDHYAVESQIRLRHRDPEDCMLLLEPRQNEKCLQHEDILKVIETEGPSIAMIMLSGVQYYTGQLFDMAAITKAAHAQGIVVGFDLAHAVGNVPLHLHDWEVDFACWCTYKYLCSGAGGIAGAFLHEKHAKTKLPKLTGWWGHNADTRFIMDNEMDLIPGPLGYRLSNPSGLLCASLKSALDVYSVTNIEVLRKKSILLTGYLEWLIKKHFSKKDGKPYIDIFTPSNCEERGCQLSLSFSFPIHEVIKELEKHGIVCDKRLPSVIRITPVHLYNSFRDVYRFIQLLRKIMAVECTKST